MEIEEDTYSSIFQALKHPIRRRILRMLKEKPMTYTEILNELGIDNGLLNYHLENLRELLAKGEDEKYRLSEFGQAGLSVIDRVEAPKNSIVKHGDLFDKAPGILLVLLLFCSAILNGYYYIDNKNLEQELLQASTVTPDYTVSGVVVHRSGNQIWLKLSAPDSVAGKDVGDITQYYIGRDSEIDVGDYLQGTLTENMTLIKGSVVPFFKQIVVHGNMLLFSGCGIKHDVSMPYSTLSFNLKNLGEKEIIAIRARVNNIELPYTFGVSQDSPLKPSISERFSCYTAWYSPGGNTGGYVPVDGEEYTVTVTVKFSDYSTRTFTLSNTYYKKDNTGSICFMISRDYVYFSEPSLLWLGRGQGGTVSLSFCNEWSGHNDEPDEVTIGALNVTLGESMPAIEKMGLYIDEHLVWEEQVSVNLGSYFAVNVPIPFELEPGRDYNVTLKAYSDEEYNSTYTVSTLCQNIRIG